MTGREFELSRRVGGEEEEEEGGGGEEDEGDEAFGKDGEGKRGPHEVGVEGRAEGRGVEWGAAPVRMALSVARQTSRARG